MIEFILKVVNFLKNMQIYNEHLFLFHRCQQEFTFTQIAVYNTENRIYSLFENSCSNHGSAEKLLMYAEFLSATLVSRELKSGQDLLSVSDLLALWWSVKHLVSWVQTDKRSAYTARFKSTPILSNESRSIWIYGSGNICWIIHNRRLQEWREVTQGD